MPISLLHEVRALVTKWLACLHHEGPLSEESSEMKQLKREAHVRITPYSTKVKLSDASVCAMHTSNSAVVLPMLAFMSFITTVVVHQILQTHQICSLGQLILSSTKTTCSGRNVIQGTFSSCTQLPREFSRIFQE